MHGEMTAKHQHGTHMPASLRTEAQGRLAKIEGQVKGLQRMIEEDRYCAEVLNQIDAARGALRQVSQLVLRNYLQNCATRAMLEGDPKVYDELMDIINRYSRE